MKISGVAFIFSAISTLASTVESTAQNQTNDPRNNFPQGFMPELDRSFGRIPYWNYTGSNRIRLFFTSLIDPRSVANYRLMSAYTVSLDQVEEFRATLLEQVPTGSSLHLTFFLPLESGHLITLPHWVSACGNPSDCLLPDEIGRLLESGNNRNLLIRNDGDVSVNCSVWTSSEFIVGPNEQSIRFE